MKLKEFRIINSSCFSYIYQVCSGFERILPNQFFFCLQDRSLDFHALCALYAITGTILRTLALVPCFF